MYNLLENLKKSRKRRKELKKFLRGLSHRKVRGLDTMAKGFHQEAVKKIDCIKCANCCRTMTPTFKKAEVVRIAKHVGMTYKEYFKKYLYYDKSGDIMNRNNPCQHLAADNKCRIYEIRPVDCSGFPHTHNRDFKLYVPETHIQNVDFCPITFSVVEKMFEKVTGKKPD